MPNAPYKYALDLLKSDQIIEAKKFLEFGSRISNSLTFADELEPKSFGRIVTDSAKNKNKINDYLVSNEAFEFDLNLITDFEAFDGLSVYAGKFSPNYEKLKEWCKLESVPIFILCRHNF